jgi:predicted transcriptional regulator
MSKLISELRQIEAKLEKLAEASVIDQAAEKIVDKMAKEIVELVRHWKQNEALLARFDLDPKTAQSELVRALETKLSAKFKVWKKGDTPGFIP